jgi:hypothetical protein
MKPFPAALLLAAACGNSPGASATFTGTVRGQPLTPTASISSPATVNFTSGSAPVAAIVLSDAPGLCRLAGQDREAKSSRQLLIYLAEVNGATGSFEVPAGTATYAVFVPGSGNPPAHFAVASFSSVDASCRPIGAQSAAAVAGSVTLSGNSGGAYAGSFDLTFDSGDRVTGAFDTAVCQALATFFARSSHACG